MKKFNYEKLQETLLTTEVMALLAQIHEFKGKQDLFVEVNADILETLTEIAKVQSTGASNKIEGISTSDKRLNEIVKSNSAPRNRTEAEIAGYRDVLSTVHENYNFIDVTPNYIRQFHKKLYSHTDAAIGGSYKNADNLIIEKDADGKETIRFKPLPAFLTEEAVQSLCDKYNKATHARKIDTLLLIPMFVLDFLCIHPFNDGNGRISRLLTLLLYYRAGYVVGKYISIEKLIEKSKETYYETLQQSSTDWIENNHDYAPFVKYMLGILIRAYSDFSERIDLMKYKKLSKPERIKAIIDRNIGKITKKEIMEQCPDISEITIKRTLAELIKCGYIETVGVARNAGYAKKC